MASSSSIVMAMIPMWGAAAASLRVASMPLMPGMARSIRTTSTWSASAASTPDAPSPATALASRPEIESMSWRMPWRKVALSSTTRTRIMPAAGRGSAGGRQRPAALGGLTEHDLAAQLGGAFPYREQSDAGTCGGVEAVTVVADLEDGFAVVAVERDPALTRVGVADDVGERLGGDPIDGELRCGGQPHRQRGEVELDRQWGEMLGVRADGRRQSEIVEDRRAQAVDDLADLADDDFKLRPGSGHEFIGGG